MKKIEETLPAVPEQTPMDRFENAIREVGVIVACEWFGHSPDSDFTKETVSFLKHKYFELTDEEMK